MRDPSLRVDPYDKLKFIPLNASGTIYLTVGLENGTEFQYLNNNNWGAGPQNPGVVLGRLMPDIDLCLEIRWAISEHFLAAMNVAGFVPGEFLKQSPPSDAIAFFNLGLTYRF